MMFPGVGGQNVRMTTTGPSWPCDDREAAVADTAHRKRNEDVPGLDKVAASWYAALPARSYPWATSLVLCLQNLL